MEENASWLEPRDAGKILELTTSGVRRLEEIGQLPAIRTSAGRRLFRREDVVRLAKARDAKRRQRPTRD